MRIQELAGKTGLTPHTIRFYEKMGLLDSRHVQRDANHYRSFSAEAIERLALVKKFQSLGCSLTELRDILQDRDTNAHTNQQVIEWIVHKIQEIRDRKSEMEHILETLDWMLAYRTALMHDPEQAEELLQCRRSRPWAAQHLATLDVDDGPHASRSDLESKSHEGRV